MATFVRLTRWSSDEKDEKVFVNMDHVVSFNLTQNDPPATRLRFAIDHTPYDLDVTEVPGQVQDLWMEVERTIRGASDVS